MGLKNARQQKATLKKLIEQRDAAREAHHQLTSELNQERTERAALIAEAVKEAQASLEGASKVNIDLRTGIADLASCVTARDALITALRGQVDDRNRELTDTREDAKNANAHVARLTEELRTNATLAEVKDLRKRLHAKTERVAELERALEKLRPTAPTMSIRPRAALVKP